MLIDMVGCVGVVSWEAFVREQTWLRERKQSVCETNGALNACRRAMEPSRVTCSGGGRRGERRQAWEGWCGVRGCGEGG